MRKNVAENIWQCNNVVSRENYIIPDERRRCKVSIANAVSQNTTGKKYPRLRSPGFAPCPSEGPLSYREHGFRLGHLFRSLFMVADGSEDDPAYYPKESEKWRCSDYSVASAPERGRFQLGRFEHMEKWVDWRRSRYRVLLVRTGDDSCLSAPISFQPLFDSGRTLPIGRNDYGSWEDAVRVRLDHALEFIEDLIRREKEALPHVRQAAETLDAELDELCEQWIGRVLEHAAEVGFDNNGFAWRAIRRARARLNGEAFDTYQVAPDWKWLRAWFMGG